MHLVTAMLFAFAGGMNYSMMTRAQILGEATDSWSWMLSPVAAVIFATLAYKFLTKPKETE